MSSDTFDIEIRKIDGDLIELDCEATGAGGVSDYACTRSFVLSVLVDGMPYQGTLPLQEGLKALGKAELWEESFHREHVAKFVDSVELVSRSGIVDDEGEWYAGRQNADSEAEADRDYPRHRFLLRARMTDARWLKGLKVGARFGTTSFDAWWNDPTRATNVQLAKVEAAASRWRPPGVKKPREAKAKAGAKKGGKATKAGAKKVAKAATKAGAKKGGKATKAGAKKVGKATTKAGAKKVAKATKAGAKKVGKATKVAKATKVGAKKVAKATKAGAKKVGKAKAGAKKVGKATAKAGKAAVKKVAKTAAKRGVAGAK